jgi:hypothetical protein
MNENKEAKGGSSPRVLGDEWKGWNGEDAAARTEAPRSLFVAAAIVSFFVIAGAALLAWYMVQPRLAMLHPGLSLWAGRVFSAALAAFALWTAAVFAEMLLLRPFPLLPATHSAFIRIYFPVARKLSAIARLNRDVFSNSFVKASNFLIGKAPARQAGKTVVLLPRCLRKDVREQVESLAKGRNIAAFVVGGGEQARRVIEKERPDSVIAVACERDLVAGIRDVAGRLAVIGPCKDTSIDIGALEEALKLFTT